MKQYQFEQLHQTDWAVMEAWLDQQEGVKKRDAKGDVQATVQSFADAEFPQRFRSLAAQLALARARHYSPPLLARLNQLALRAHQQFYRPQLRPWHHLLNFFVAGFPRQMRKDWRFLSISALMFFGPLLAMMISIQWQPQLVYSLMDSQQVLDVQQMYDPKSEHVGTNRESASDVLMFGFYIRNNIGISFQTYASGIIGGLGSLFFLIFNGLYIGAVAGHLIQIGSQVPFFSFVSGHSGPELSAIVIAGAAGLKLGWSLIAPGPYRRVYALKRAAKASMILIYGDILLLILAAFLEAFWSSNMAFPPLFKYCVGISIWLLLLAYVLLVGRKKAY